MKSLFYSGSLCDGFLVLWIANVLCLFLIGRKPWKGCLHRPSAQTVLGTEEASKIMFLIDV